MCIYAQLVTFAEQAAKKPMYREGYFCSKFKRECRADCPRHLQAVMWKGGKTDEKDV